MPALLSRQRLWQRSQVSKGRCMGCGGLRPPDLSLRCRLCQDKWNLYQRLGPKKERT